jgi:hypothetical protein
VPSVTGNTIIQDSFSLLNVFQPGVAIPNVHAKYALRLLNDMMSEWSQRAVFVPVISRERFDLVANQGGPDDPYTIGPGGDFDTERPSNQGSITAANLILTSTSPEVRVPLGIYTDDAYDANQLPSMSNTQPTGMYYNPTYDNDLGSVFLWPVPTIATNDLELFIQKSVAQFSNLSTTYYVPDGYPQAMKYNLADRLQAPYGRELAPSAMRLAVSTMDTVKRSNLKMTDMANDIQVVSSRRTLYNIQTGSGG